jgi:hypothetical protein
VDASDVEARILGNTRPVARLGPANGTEAEFHMKQMDSYRIGGVI